MFFNASEYKAGMPGMNVTLVPVDIAAASSREMNSGVVLVLFDAVMIYTF
jgi:hypothetical protein